jgi:similar to stage IV sporulation protein
MAKKEIKSQLDEDAIIKEEKILQKTIKNGIVFLDIHFTVIENIAVGQPIPKETPE